MTSIDHGVRKSWDRLAARHGDRLRGTPVRAAADKDRIRAVEADIGLAFPAEVRDWWTLDGVSADYWIPGPFAPVDLEEALETREIWLQVAEEEGDVFDANGEPEPRFLPSFLPIAMSPGGDGLVIDLRPGDSYGAVLLWDHETWVLAAPLWDSVAAMLGDIATLRDNAGAPSDR
ncbi:SMI1/KNR4 family protein [Streptomyces lateritius]|uniref:SMI1/KNR4 family protein n=1 Tax=Streptomyces lateritius TaxID=67313 RepID=A0ABW6YK29_9ACTN